MPVVLESVCSESCEGIIGHNICSSAAAQCSSRTIRGRLLIGSTCGELGPCSDAIARHEGSVVPALPFVQPLPGRARSQALRTPDEGARCGCRRQEEARQRQEAEARAAAEEEAKMSFDIEQVREGLERSALQEPPVAGRIFPQKG